MSHHSTNDCSAAIEVANAPEAVFKSITADVAKWWGGKDLVGNSTTINDEFIILHPGTHYSKQKLVEVIPNRKVVWLVTDSHLHWLTNPDEWTNTKMVFEISNKADRTVLHFTHEGLVPEKKCYEKCSGGWNMVIKEWLFTFITKGKAHF